jgi:hypothetical protein
MREIRLPVGADELRSYFASVSAEYPEDAHWRNGVEMCDWWLRLCNSSSVGQADIDMFIKRLSEEKDAGSGWLDLGMQFRHWAKLRGFEYEK